MVYITFNDRGILTFQNGVGREWRHTNKKLATNRHTLQKSNKGCWIGSLGPTPPHWIHICKRLDTQDPPLGVRVGQFCWWSLWIITVLTEVCGDRSYVIKFETSMLPLSNFLIFTTYLLCLVDVFFNRQSAWHTYGNKLCSSSRRHVPLFVSGRLHTGASQEKRKEATLNLLFHVPLYRWCPFTK